MTEGAYEVLHAAVDIAREEQVRTTADLQARLAKVFPGREEDVTSALSKWAEYVGKHGC